MQVSVLKFGGSSLADAAKIKHVGQIISKHAKQPTLVVLSAMQGETARLLELAASVASLPKGRDLDVLLSTGEQVTAALMALHLSDLGVPAIALDARAIGLQGVGAHQSALVKALDKSVLTNYLAQGLVPIVTGFQVVLPNNSVATMERGGSDTTAVALAAAFKAKCYIYSDVAGVYSADPNVVTNAKPWSAISYAQMLALSKVGAKVLQYRAIQLASKYQVPLLLRSTYNSMQETKVLAKGADVSNFFGLAITNQQYLVQIPKQVALADLVDSGIVLSELTVRADCYEAVVAPEYLSLLKALIKVEVSPMLVKLSLVGLQDRYQPKLLSLMHAALVAADVEPKLYSATNHGLEFWVLAEQATAAANILHDFSLADAIA